MSATSTLTAHQIVGGMIEKDDQEIEHIETAENLEAEVFQNRLRDHLYLGGEVSKIPAADPLVHGYIDKNSLTLLYAPSGIGKTFVALDIACCVGYGKKWHGQDVERGRVLYLYLEGAQGASARYMAWLERNQVTDDAHSVAFMTAHDFNMYAPSNNGETAPLNRDMLDILEIIEDIQPTLIVLDTYAVATTGADENRAEHVNVIVQHLKTMKASASAAVLVVHHPGKDEAKGMRGSNALLGASDAVFAISSTGDNCLSMVSIKHKDRPTGGDGKNLQLTPTGTSVAITQRSFRDDEAPTMDQTNLDAILLEALRDSDEGNGVSWTKWYEFVVEAAAEARTSEPSNRTAARRRNALIDSHKVVKTGSGNQVRYVLQSSAQEAIDL